MKRYFSLNARMDEATLRGLLDSLINSEIRGVLSSVPLHAVLTEQRASLMDDITRRVNGKTKDLGVEVVDVRIKRVDLPESVSENVFRRMEAEQFRDAVAQVVGVWYDKADFPIATNHIRAALVAADPLTTALGRPNREQVVTVRSTAATTLQGLELTNGETLAHILERGAKPLLALEPVLVNDERLHDYWKVPEQGFAACVCVPLISQSMPLGTLWAFSNQWREFSDELMYMSGPPLHVLTLNLVKRFREQMGGIVALSFFAGVTAQNFANTAAIYFVPVTTCTDLLKPGGYGRLHKYLDNLGGKMRAVGATTISEFVVRHAGRGSGAIERVAQKLEAALGEPAPGTEGFFQRAARTWVREGFVPALQKWLAAPRKPLRPTCEELTRKIREHGQIIPDSLVGRFALQLAAIVEGVLRGPLR